MRKTYQPNYELNHQILFYLNEISRKQGEILGWQRTHDADIKIESLANIDAVHYSTKIEGNQLTIHQVTKALTTDKHKLKTTRDLKEILSYSKARKILVSKANKQQKITIKLILEIHAMLMQGIVSGQLKGFLREAQNVIRDSKTNGIVYMPPLASDVNSLMRDLVDWLRVAALENINSLIVAAVFHYRFVTIHPFMDGNGRLARLFSNYILSLNDYDVGKYAALEKQHEKNRSLYYKLLRASQAHNFYDIPEDVNLTKWIEYILDCLNKTYDEAIVRMTDQNSMTSEHVDLAARQRKALSLFNKYKSLKAADYEALMGIGRTQAVSDLNHLLESGYIKKVGGGRSTVYKKV
jgi:Fic family protein